MTQGILCFGAAHVDRKAYAQTEIRLKTSLPVSVQNSLGGVARNVAENLARLRCQVALVSRVGLDKEAEWVRKHSLELGIDVNGLTVSGQKATASYTALLDETGEMVLGLADMDIYEELTPALLDELPEVALERPIWFLDANAPETTLRALLERAGKNQMIAIDPVSVPKAKKLLGLLPRIDFLFPNRDEAEVLSGIEIRTMDDVARAGEIICQQGTGHVIITLGAEGVCAVSEAGARFYPAMPAEVQDVTGAGDALLAGFLYGYEQSGSVEQAVRIGIAAATVTIGTGETVHPQLSPELVQKIMQAHPLTR